MTPTLLRETGESLYGARWQSELARDLAINDRTMRRWLAGTNGVPEQVREELRVLAQARRKALDQVIARLR
jgi:hypothetical protein